MSHHIYFRILGYIVTIAMHSYNWFTMATSFHGEPMKNAHVQHFCEMQHFFFTCWSFFFQIVYAVLALYTDILTLKNSKSAGYELPKILADGRDAMFSIVVWPSTLLVFALFWPVFFYDRELFYPKDLDMAITGSSNHIMHTLILPVVLWEIFFRRMMAPKTHKWHMFGVWLVLTFYFCAMIFIFITRGVWVYPIFEVIYGSIFFYLFLAFISALLVPLYYSQWALNSVVWGSNENSKKLC